MSRLEFHRFDADAIAQLDVSSLEKNVTRSITAYHEDRTPLPLIMVFTSAFDPDPRALYDIPEMRSWCARLYERVPYIFSLIDSSTMNWLFPAVAEITVTHRDLDTTDYKFVSGSDCRLAQEILANEMQLFQSLASNKDELASLLAHRPTRALDRLGES